MMVLGAYVYVVLDTGLVSLVISLAEGQSLKQIWPQCYEWTFPYFLVGAAVAGLASTAGPHSVLFEASWQHTTTEGIAPAERCREHDLCLLFYSRL